MTDLTLPPRLGAALATLQREGRVLAAIQTDHRHDFAPKRSAPLWLVLLDDALLEIAIDARDQVWSTRHELLLVGLDYKSGFIKDTLVLGEHSWELPIGAGKLGRAFFDACDVHIRARREPEDSQEHGELALRQDATQLERIGGKWFDAPSEAITRAALALLTPNERIIGLLPGHPISEHIEHACLLVTTIRALVIESRHDDHAPRVTTLQPEELALETSSIDRDELTHRGRLVLESPRFKRGGLRKLCELAALEPATRSLNAALEHIESKDWADAADLLEEAAKHAPHAAPTPKQLEQDEALLMDAEDDSALAERVAVSQRDRDLDVREQILLRRAQVAARIGAEADAINWLQQLSAARLFDDLIELTRELAGDDLGWWLLLAIAHEEASQFDDAASVYELMAAHKQGDPLFLLQAARNAHRAAALHTAMRLYAEFIGSRTSAEDFHLISSASMEADDLEDTSGDPDLVNACVELGALQEERAMWSEAAATYLTLIRQSPFSTRGYERLFALSHRLTDQPHIEMLLGQLSEVLELLDPNRANTLREELGGLPVRPAPIDLPVTYYGVLDDARHDATIMHSGEKATSTLAQKWLSGLMLDVQSTRDIERHCQQVGPRTHPEADELLSRVSSMLLIQTPRCFLSHGMTGARVMSSDLAPFLLVGAAHFDPEHPQYMTPRQLGFALASQLEHIRADHLMLTTSEFWGGFADGAISGAVTLLSLIPIGGMLGSFANSFAAPLIDKVRTGWNNSAVRYATDYARKRLDDGIAADGIQGAYEATLGRVISRAKPDQRDEESLIKEQLADFARCAMYTSDRIGLLATDSLSDAVRAILLLAPRTATELSTLDRDGLHGLLSRRGADGELVNQELALRLSELLKFAISDEYLELRQNMLAPAHATRAVREEE